MLSTLSSHISPSRSGFPIGAQTVTKDNFAEYLPHIKRTLTLQGGAVGRSLVSGTSLPLLVEPKEFDSDLVGRVRTSHYDLNEAGTALTQHGYDNFKWDRQLYHTEKPVRDREAADCISFLVSTLATSSLQSLELEKDPVSGYLACLARMDAEGLFNLLVLTHSSSSTRQAQYLFDQVVNCRQAPGERHASYVSRLQALYVRVCSHFESHDPVHKGHAKLDTILKVVHLMGADKTYFSTLLESSVDLLQDADSDAMQRRFERFEGEKGSVIVVAPSVSQALAAELSDLPTGLVAPAVSKRSMAPNQFLPGSKGGCPRDKCPGCWARGWDNLISVCTRPRHQVTPGARALAATSQEDVLAYMYAMAKARTSDSV